MSSSQYSVKPFIPSRDAAMVNAWARAHGREEGLPMPLLPPDGIVVLWSGAPVAAGWLYKSLGVGVAFLEHVHTRPGLGVAEAREAIEQVVAYFRFDARQDDYGVILCHTAPALGRFAPQSGWRRIRDGLVQMALETGLGPGPTPKPEAATASTEVFKANHVEAFMTGKEAVA